MEAKLDGADPENMFSEQVLRLACFLLDLEPKIIFFWACRAVLKEVNVMSLQFLRTLMN